MLQPGQPWWQSVRHWFEWRPWFTRRKLAEPPDPPEPSGAERRQAIRFGISLETSARLLAMVQDDPRPVRVRNISVGGISLVIGREVATHSLLDIELLNRPKMFLCKLQVRITYAVEHPTGDWILGGAFTRKLSEEELESLLA